MNLIRPESLLFLDIETSGSYQNLKNFQESDPTGSDIFHRKYEKKVQLQTNWGVDEGLAYLHKSPLFPQYGKIICLSLGTYQNGQIKIKSLVGTEEEIIKSSLDIFEKAGKLQWSLSGFNIKKFDLPWLNHKYVKYGLKIPYLSLTFGKKPWEINVLDLSELWYIDYVSFEEMCYELGVESPKKKLSGEKVHESFYDGQLPLIKEYCESDVRASIECYLKIYQSQ